MRTRDGGPKLQHPCSPCPIFGLGDRRFLFLFHDNDGYVFGADDRWHVRNRRPTYACVGEFRPGAEQPIWWGEARAAHRQRRRALGAARRGSASSRRRT